MIIILQKRLDDMAKIQIALYNSNRSDNITLYDRSVRMWQYLFHRDDYCKYTHVELVINGLFFSSSPRDGGVRFKNIKPKSTDWDFMELDIDDVHLDNLMNNMRLLVGKKYDWLGIFMSQVMHTTINNQSKWFCSEITAMLLNRHTKYIMPPAYSKYDVSMIPRILVNEYGLKIPN